MRLTCSRDELASRLALAARAASTKSTIQVLSHLLLTAGDGRVELAATDMELSLRVPVTAEVAEGGSVAVPRLAGDVVRAMPDGPVSLSHRENEGIVNISAGRSEFSLNCMQPSDFPQLPGDEGEGIHMPAGPFIETADIVGRAASRDETRPVLTGVLVRIGPDGLTMVATDSYRLAVRRAELERPPAEAAEAIVPARALGELGRLAAAAGGDEIEIVLSQSQALFRAGDMRLTTRIIDGQFPDYRQLVPESFEHDVVFDREELLSVLSRIAVLAQRNSPVRMRFTEGEVAISTSSDQIGAGLDTLPVAFSGEELEIGFNVEFLRAGTESIAGEEVRLGLISPLRPGLLRGADDRYQYLLMPIRLNV